MTSTHKTTHAAEALARLIERLKGQPRIAAIIEAFSAQTQGQEDAGWQLKVSRWVSSAVGAQLDGIGEIVGEPRSGKSDDVYRTYLTARILVNLSSGTADELLALALLLTSTGASTLHEHYPAALLIDIGHESLDLTDPLLAILAQAKVGGVRLQLQYSTTDDDEAFTFSSGDAEEASITMGWADDEYIVNHDFSSWTSDKPDGWITYEISANVDVTEVGSGETHAGSGSGSCNIYNNTSGSVAPYIRQEIPVLFPGSLYTLSIVISAISGSLLVEDSAWEAFPIVTYADTGTKTIEVRPSQPLVVPNLAALGYSEATIDSVSFTSANVGGQFADVKECM